MQLLWKQTESKVKDKDLTPIFFVESEHYDGDEQTPDLVCENCRAIYRFSGFKARRQ